MAVADRIIQHAGRLTTAERRVAEVIGEEPDAIAFGTVAHVARKASTSGPTVVRFAVKLGYAGFVDLQAQVQREMAELLGPARDRIRQQPPVDLLGRVAAVEEHNVRRTLGSVPPVQFAGVVEQLSDPDRAVWVLPGDVTAPVGATLAVPLAQLRTGVTLVAGSGVAAARTLGALRAGDVLVAIDIRRYERWLVEVTRWAVQAGAVLIAITDSPLSPLAALAAEALLMSAEGVGPFDSMTAGVALANALVAGVSARVRPTATPRLDAIEAAWSGTASLVAEPDGSVLPTPAPARRMVGARPAAPS
ncbi:MAG: MurR/RpiR family transcriptional regulator, partial [Acidimicrobiales bacterium]